MFDVFVGLLDCVVLEWRLSEQQRIHDHPNRPDIHLIGVPILLQYLRSDIVRSPADSLLELALMFDPCRQPEIAYLGIHVVIDEDIAQLEIPVDDRLRVDIDEGLDHLIDIHSGLILCDTLPPFHQILQRVITAVLQQYVHILPILERLYELNNVLMFERTMDLNFNQQLVALPLLVDRFLGDDLGGIDQPIFMADHLEAFREAARAQQFAASVLDIVDLIVERLFLFSFFVHLQIN